VQREGESKNLGLKKTQKLSLCGKSLGMQVK
jgi:hypothetical protein